MFLGYNTNGLAHHDVFDAVHLLAEIGYRGVAITIDHTALSPNASYSQQRVVRMRRLLDSLGMRSAIETGARFLLDPRERHEPTLLSASPVARARRIDFYKYAIDCAAELKSDCVSLWSGVLHDPCRAGILPAGSSTGILPAGCGAGVPPAEAAGTAAPRVKAAGTAAPQADRSSAMDRLAAGLREVLDYAAERGVTVAFEPEPGMFIATMLQFEELLARIDGTNLRLALDVGHLHCQGETPIAEVIRRWAPRLANVHIEDMRAGVHEHLMFGDGHIDFPPVLRALADSGYPAGLYVELSRHSHEGPAAARKAFEFLKPITENL